MKKTVFTLSKALVLPFFALLLFTTGCKKTETTPDRDKFLGVFRSISDNCRTTSYQITVSASSQATDKMIITNLNNVSSLSLICNVSGNSFTVEQTTQNNQTITGNGILNGSVLNVNYAVQQGATSFTCTASFNKQ